MREITYLAITIDAYKRLIPQSMRRKLTEKWKTVSAERFVSFMEDIDQTFREDYLLRCLEEQTLILHHAPQLRFQQDARLSRPGRLRQLVSSTYHMFRIGYIRPQQAFIRETETTENIIPKPEHALWDKHKNGILVRGPPFGLCLYVTTSRADFLAHPKEFFKNLASRFTLDEQVFNARTAHSAGVYRGSMRKSKDWSQQQHLAADEECLDLLAEWILSIISDRKRLERRRDLFPSIDMFEMLVRFIKRYNRGGHDDWNGTFTSTNKERLYLVNKV
jgi:hypothetical protein